MISLLFRTLERKIGRFMVLKIPFDLFLIGEDKVLCQAQSIPSLS
jgi:hypothetical protein